MGRLCGGAHEISGIKAPLFLHGRWLEGSWGGWMGGWWLVGLLGGWVVVVVMWVVGWVGEWVDFGGVGGVGGEGWGW